MTRTFVLQQIFESFFEILSVVMRVVVTHEQFENVKNVLIHQKTTLPCNATYDENIVWYHEQYCDDFEHGLYYCSSPAVVATGGRYQIYNATPGKHSLVINSVTKNMTGLYTCKHRETQTVIDRVLVNVMCKYDLKLRLYIECSNAVVK